MTTIAYRAGVLASDSRLSDGKKIVLNNNVQKLYKLPDGAAVALAGEDYSGKRLLKALMDGANSKAKSLPTGDFKGVEALLVCPNKQVFWFECGTWDRVDDTYTALGSGWTYAMCAMDAGASAVAAVGVGIKRDPFSGGKVQRLKVFSLAPASCQHAN